MDARCQVNDSLLCYSPTSHVHIHAPLGCFSIHPQITKQRASTSSFPLQRWSGPLSEISRTSNISLRYPRYICSNPCISPSCAVDGNPTRISMVPFCFPFSLFYPTISHPPPKHCSTSGCGRWAIRLDRDCHNSPIPSCGEDLRVAIVGDIIGELGAVVTGPWTD